jgi:hypothetical protein
MKYMKSIYLKATVVLFMAVGLASCASDPANSAREKVTKVQSRGLRLSDEEKAAFNESVCSPSTCDGAVATLSRWDPATVQCVKVDVHPCFPYGCAIGDTKTKYCANECTANSQCSSGAVCNSKKRCVPIVMRADDVEPYRAPEPKSAAKPEATPVPTPTEPVATPAPSATPESGVVAMPAATEEKPAAKPAAKKPVKKRNKPVLPVQSAVSLDYE